MTTYNIYGYNNGEEDGPVSATVTLNDDDTEIVSVTSADPEAQAQAESVLQFYMDDGLPALDALARLAGDYGTVKRANPDGSLVAAAEPNQVEVGPSDAAYSPIPDGIMAMTGDNGIVETLLRVDDEFGAIIRHGGVWVPMTDPTIIEGLAFVGVTDDAVDVYDRHETAGKLAPIKHYPPSPDGPFWPDPVIYEEGELEEDEYDGEEDVDAAPAEDAPEVDDAIAASAILNTLDDLEDAILAAINDPDLRWYVERRVAALGLETSLPWQRA